MRYAISNVTPYLIWGFLGLFLFSCTSTRRKKDVSGLGKFYHNTTAKYNGYFNANELLEEAIFGIENGQQDNFNQLLPIYKWYSSPNVESFFPQLDTAIKKVSVVASLHTPSKWTDDCYLLAGQAHYIKQDYEQAEITFQYLVDEFDPSNPTSRFWEYRQDEIRKKKKKEKQEEREERKEIRKEKDKERKQSRKDRLRERKKNARSRKKGRSRKNYRSREEREAAKKRAEQKELAKANEVTGKASKEQEEETVEETNPLFDPTVNAEDYKKMGHVPAYFEGQIWLARSLMERDQFNRAFTILRKLKNDETISADLQEFLYGSLADLFIAKKEYSDAIPHLEKALNVGRDRQQNARYAFVAAQISQRAGNPSAASAYFAEAKKLSNQYEMEFSALLASEKNAYFMGAKSQDEVMKVLERELDDGKNVEYLDLIYYTMYQVSQHAGDTDNARHYLAQALQSGNGSNAIAMEAYYSLATYYFQEGDYAKAKLYYDSTMQVLPKSDSRYLPSKDRHESLKELVERMQIVEENDSALVLGEMSPEERQALVEQKVKKKEQAEEKAKEEQEEGIGGTFQNNRPATGGSKSSFFAYDQQKVIKGEQDFRFRWGDRPLIDDWRRNDRLSLEQPEQQIAKNANSSKGTGSKVQESKILGDFPKTEAEKAAVRQKLVSAMYDLAVIYREKLDRPDLAATHLKEVIERFPRSTVDEKALYAMVLCQRELGMKSEEQRYKDLLLDRYPQSEFAKILTDPNYAQTAMKEAQAVENYYQNTYNELSQGNYARAKTMAEQGMKRYSQDEKYLPKFHMILAMSKGKTNGQEAYAEELRTLIKLYERSEEATRAREIIRFLNGEERAFVRTEGQMGDFILEEDKLHYVIAVLYNARELDMNQNKIKMSDFNRKYYNLKDLLISNIYLDLNSGVPILIVRKFDNKDMAMRYYSTAKQYSEDFLPEKAKYDLFAVSQKNYRAILKQRTVEGYRPFFEQYYLREAE